MIWITIILDLITALPSVIKLIQEILELIRGQPIGEQLRHTNALKTMLLTWSDSRDHVALESGLNSFATQLKGAVN